MEIITQSKLIKLFWLFTIGSLSILFIVAMITQPVMMVFLFIFTGLVILIILDKSWFRTGIILLLAILPFTGIMKAIFTNRYAPLAFDLGIIFFCAVFLIFIVFVKTQKFGIVDLIWFTFWLLALAQMFNPNVPSIQAGIEGFRKFYLMSIAFFAGRYILRLTDIVLFQKLLLLFSFPITIYGIKQFIEPSNLDYRLVELAAADRTTYFMGGHLRPFSTLPGTFHLGLYLIVTILLIVSLLVVYKPSGTLNRIFILILLILQAGLLIFTRTKGNWVGLVVGLFVFILVAQGDVIKKIGRMLMLGILALLVLGIISSIVEGNASTVLSDAFFAVSHPKESPTLIFRQDIWKEQVIPAMIREPLLGYGTSSAGEGLNSLYLNTNSQFFVSHNLYFKVFLELGLPGFVLFCLLIGLSIFKGTNKLRLNTSTLEPGQIQIWRWSFAVVIAFLTAGLVIPVLDAYPVGYYFWLLLGVLSAKIPARV